MPQLGETVAEGKITVWFKSVGDSVAPGDNLFEIETDKVSMEVPATSAGILKEIRVQQGEVAPVSAIVAIIADSGVPVPKAALQTKQAPPATLEPYNEVHTPARNFGPARLANGVTVSPLARRLAVEAGVDLERVKGSGPFGRIHAEDVKASMAAPTPAPRAAATPVRALYKDVPFEEVPLDAMRRTIARRLVEAKQTIPHFYLVADVDIDASCSRLRTGKGLMPRTSRNPPKSRSTISSSRDLRWRCSACLPPTRCGRKTPFCASNTPTSESRWRSKAGFSRR